MATSHPVYHDHSDKDDEWIRQRKLATQAGESSNSAGTQGTFPCKLHYMLENVARTGHESVVRWLSHGRAFKVYDKKRFELDVMPTYFQTQGRFLSFQRQLNLYGFLRLTGRGPDQSAYYNELLLRGRPELSTLIVRKSVSESSVRRTFDPSTEPNFYCMAPLEAMEGNEHKCSNKRKSNRQFENDNLIGYERMVLSHQHNSSSDLACRSLRAETEVNNVSEIERATDKKLSGISVSPSCQRLGSNLLTDEHNHSRSTHMHGSKTSAEPGKELLEEIRLDLCPEFNHGVDTYDWLQSIDMESFWD